MRPKDVPDEMVVAATMALTEHGLEFYQVEPLIRGITGRVPPHGLRAAIAAVYPLIRDAVIEECAKLADWHATGHAMSMHAYGSADKDGGRGRQEGHVHAGEAIASAIRALKDTTP